MLTIMLRKTRNTIGEWRCRTRSRGELVILSELERRDLGCRFDLKAEMRKPFWQC